MKATAMNPVFFQQTFSSLKTMRAVLTAQPIIEYSRQPVQSRLSG
jgi:hypothetical protein